MINYRLKRIKLQNNLHYVPWSFYWSLNWVVLDSVAQIQYTQQDEVEILYNVEWNPNVDNNEDNPSI